jgi:hypothetical protein
MNILVTNWSNHWAGIGNRETSYPNGMIHGDPSQLQENIESILTRVDAANRIQQGWRGAVRNIRRTSQKTYFKVVLNEELDSSQLREYEGYRPGWYVKSSEQTPAENRADARFLPNFVSELEETQDYAEFEELVYVMLRLLGIHRAYRISQDEQAGKADGFFKVSNLAVIYDCTLRTEYEGHKKQQIENYCNQLLHGVVQIPPNISERVTHHQKQVWIITRDKSRILQNVGDIGNVIVKEIAISDIKKLYLDRLLISMTEDELENRLRSLGQT